MTKQETNQETPFTKQQNHKIFRNKLNKKCEKPMRVKYENSPVTHKNRLVNNKSLFCE